MGKLFSRKNIPRGSGRSTIADDRRLADIRASVELLRKEGPQLGRPYAETVNGSRHANMKEMRTQSGGRPLRSFFAFDPQRTAVILIGGDKTGDKRFYEQMIRQADDLYDLHLLELKRKE